jgi:hypothetical protein
MRKNNMRILKELGKAKETSEDKIVTKTGGNVEQMIKKIHEAAGTPKVEEKETDGASNSDRIVDAPVAKEVESADPDPAPAPENNQPMVFSQIPETMIQGLIDQGMEKVRAEEQRKQKEIELQMEKIAAELEKQKEETRIAEDKAANLLKFQEKFGISASASTPGIDSNKESKQPPQIIVRSSNTISGADALKEYWQLRESCPKKAAQTYAGDIVEQRDTRYADEWLREHRSEVLNGLEQKYQEAGKSGGKEAVTARTDIAGLIMETVSDMVRITQHPNHIWKNFVDYTIDIGRDSGNGINVPRYAFAEGSTDTADWDLTNVTTLTTDAQPIQASTIRIPVQEYGMGKPGLPANRNKPIGVNLFINSISVQDMMNVVSNNLGYNYAQFETATILYGLLNSTTTVYYNQKGEPITTPGTLAAGDGGQCDWDFLTGLSAEMSSQGVPAYANGKYLLGLAPKDLATLEKSLRANMQFLNRASITDLTSIFKQSANNSDINYSGYKGDIGDFMVFDSATLAAGPFAATLPANTETIAGSPLVMRTGFACGAHAIGRGVAMPFNIRESDQTDFQRQRILAWNSYEGYAAMDLNAVLSPVGTLVPQQTRVFKLRFTSTAI